MPVVPVGLAARSMRAGFGPLQGRPVMSLRQVRVIVVKGGDELGIFYERG